MNMKRRKLLCMLVAAVMLLSLAACGKGKNTDPNLLKIGDYELRYKGAEIMTDYDGNDAIVATLDYTNNSKEATTYLWSFVETATQNGTELKGATIFLSEDSLDTVTDSQFSEVAPGATLEVQLAYVLADAAGEVVLSFEEVFGSENGKFTIDPSTLSRESAGSGSASLAGGGKGDGSGGEAGVSGGGTGASSSGELRDWWNGDWYGWWVMTSCYGYYEDMEGEWWDVCGTIDIGEDGTGTVILWDEDYTESEPMAAAAVSLSELGTGEFGTLMSEDGWFTDITLEHADWIVDPGLAVYPDMVHIDGYYENGDDEFTYDIYLRPWGSYWDDVAEDQLPGLYDDWYLPLIEAGEPMPDSIG